MYGDTGKVKLLFYFSAIQVHFLQIVFELFCGVCFLNKCQCTIYRRYIQHIYRLPVTKLLPLSDI